VLRSRGMVTADYLVAHRPVSYVLGLRRFFGMRFTDSSKLATACFLSCA
jgi:hypothetical protein